MLAKITSKGQVTIPQEIRKKLGIGKDDRVDFVIEGSRVVLVPVKTLKNLRGAVKKEGSGDFTAERETAKTEVGKRVTGEVK